MHPETRCPSELIQTLVEMIRTHSMHSFAMQEMGRGLIVFLPLQLSQGRFGGEG